MNSVRSLKSNRRPCGFLLVGSSLLVAALALTSGCGRVSEAQARRLVERYNQVVSEAYRKSDVRLIDPVVGLKEGRKLTGLIGVRQDLGLALDSQLLFLEVTGVEQLRDELRVRTRERWTYRDVRLNNGAPVGEVSQDAYEMLYLFKREKERWLVDEIQFRSPPQIGRKQAAWLAEGGELPLHDSVALEKEALQP